MNYWPEEEERPEGAGPLRYIAIRMRKRQGELFADGSEAKYFVVASNQWEWDAARLLEWQREKAGTIEALHDVLKNELAAGVMPCGRFGANAAWLRLAVMTHNVLTALKRLALPEEWLTARPKRMRFQIFFSPGKLVTHARKIWLRVRRLKEQLAEWIESLRCCPCRSAHKPPYGRIIRVLFSKTLGVVSAVEELQFGTAARHHTPPLRFSTNRKLRPLYRHPSRFLTRCPVSAPRSSPFPARYGRITALRTLVSSSIIRPE